MHKQEFPVFTDGQTLTHTELNDLREFLDAEDHVLGRLIGFGISCGLDGSVTDGTLRISPGLAIDQRGRALLLDQEVRIDLPATADASFEFLDGTDCLTPVLVAEDVLNDAPDCEEDGCIRHASLLVRAAEVRLGLGSVRQPTFSVASTALGSVSPVVVGRNSRASNTGAALIAALNRALRDELDDAVLARLGTALISTSADLPGVQAWKAAFLNRVYFATLDLLRCRALTSGTCIRESATPGVALGCLDLATRNWSCSPRHGWQPPRGLAVALLGSDCDDPCGLLADRVGAMIGSFAIPPMPQPDDPPRPGGGFHYCPRKYGTGTPLYRDTYLFRSNDCIHWDVPFQPFEDWRKWWDDIAVNPGEIVDVGDIYRAQPDVLGAGTVGVGTALGMAVDDARFGLETTVRDAMGAEFPADVRVVTPAERNTLTGFEPAVEASVADQIVLVADTHGKVVEVGRVSVSGALNTVAPTINKLDEKATTASTNAVAAAEAAASAATLAQSATDGIAGLRVDTAQMIDIINGAGDGGGLLGKVGRLESSLGEFTKQPPATVGFVEAKTLASERLIDAKIAQLQAEVTASVTNTTTEFRQELTEWIGRADGRIDTAVFTAAGKGKRLGVDQGVAGAFSAITEVVRATAGRDPDPDVREALRAADAAVAKIEATADVGDGLDQQAIVAAFDGVTAAVKSLGATDRQLKNVETALKTIRTRPG